jgi:hypothetical protein
MPQMSQKIIPNFTSLFPSFPLSLLPSFPLSLPLSLPLALSPFLPPSLYLSNPPSEFYHSLHNPVFICRYHIKSFFGLFEWKTVCDQSV